MALGPVSQVKDRAQVFYVRPEDLVTRSAACVRDSDRVRVLRVGSSECVWGCEINPALWL